MQHLALASQAPGASIVDRHAMDGWSRSGVARVAWASAYERKARRSRASRAFEKMPDRQTGWSPIGDFELQRSLQQAGNEAEPEHSEDQRG